MATSTVPDAIDALLTLVQADSAFANAGVSWAPPPPDRLKHEQVWVGDFEVDEEPHTLGDLARAESYEVPVVISVERSGYDQKQTEKRAWTLAAAVESLVRNNKQLGAAWTNRFEVETKGKRRRAFPTADASWACEVTVLVGVDAYI